MTGYVILLGGMLLIGAIVAILAEIDRRSRREGGQKP
jgi:hypothetical protein